MREGWVAQSNFLSLVVYNYSTSGGVYMFSHLTAFSRYLVLSVFVVTGSLFSELAFEMTLRCFCPQHIIFSSPSKTHNFTS